MTFEAVARAKINLGLAVVGRRPDGYHELRSVFLRIGLSDLLLAELRDPSSALGDRLTVTGDRDVPIDGNLVTRAVDLLRASVPGTRRALELRLYKRIPVAAGLGGGSADAAAALDLAASMWGIKVASDQRDGLALSLGSDVPFFSRGHAAALVSGIGESVQELRPPTGRIGLLLISPPVGAATPAVYAAFVDLPPPRGAALETVEALAAAFDAGLGGAALAGWSDRLADANDLWPAVIRVAPELAAIRTDVEARLHQRVFLTGSGSTLVGLYPSPEMAISAGGDLVADLPPSLAGARVFATDDLGPDPRWRFP